MMRDDKLVRVALRCKQPVERVVWVWGAILESAAEVDDGGRFDVDAAEVAYFLRTDEADVCAVIRGLEDAGRLDGSTVAKWGDRQFSSDRSKERQAAYRERKKAGQGRGDGVHNDDNAGDSDAAVTSPSRHRDAPETEAETEELEPEGSCASDDALRPEHIVSSWNDQIAPALGKPQVRMLTPERRVRLKPRIAGFTVAEFREVISNILESPFLRGDTGWQGFSFDWFTKKANFVKILEGNYNV
jgi:hypothetical protein